ncbi:MAG: hypothetical protein UX65_C0003G0017 [Parcubacteria group bacterium GW2011_GWB1_46_8]|nr:MAG: hypothetical protein UX14_C0012G0007 [Parcubacteria group bacterium GW2011_GWF1_45_5]KKU10711.1 MAG: hypothetical protein UX15_C0023G0005 [Parcubacteria group bacterium GW2011_GWA1_45_7]KKU43186.1 MAG: hypothetical protein UX61_C0027G0003 [Parcubacteria group bacterium GW2011_GWA2_46_7]KKU46474.1 MAG: hypothetical protein UX65_C0003G0017 [Parcubacteria group bacterium GW2011_GWB1_46_8]OGJ05213.1 MAG: hypothetical protein A2357_00945 [Candidatus Nomurabacteria bacterium RIFOXYB1_FULL_43_
MKLDQILKGMGAGERPSDDEMEAAQRAEGEIKEDQETTRGIKKCQTITELVDFLRTIPGIQGSKEYYPSEVLVALVEQKVSAFRRFDAQTIRGMTVEAIEKFLRKVTNHCELRDKLAELIHKLAL